MQQFLTLYVMCPADLWQTLQVANIRVEVLRKIHAKSRIILSKTKFNQHLLKVKIYPVF